jgi:hypothetical protein
VRELSFDELLVDGAGQQERQRIDRLEHNTLGFHKASLFGSMDVSVHLAFPRNALPHLAAGPSDALS